MNKRILLLINVLLVLVCIGCIYYLVTAEYSRPAVLVNRGPLPADETELEETPRVVINPPSYPQLVTTEMFGPLYTPPPTPTPTPTPTPPPPNLEQAVFTWRIISMDANSVEFVEARPEGEEVFKLTVGGPPRISQDKMGQEVPVSLKSVNLNDFTAVLVYENQEYPVSY